MLRHLLIVAALLVAGCAGPSQNLIRLGDAAVSDSASATVVMRLDARGPGVLFGIGTGRWSPNSAMREVGSQRHFYLFGRGDKFVTFTVPPGRYQFLHFSPRHFMRVPEPLLHLAYDGSSDIPVRPVEMKAGETVYLGDLTVEGIGFEQVVTSRQPGITYRVAIDETAARAALDAESPGRGAAMVTRPFVIEPDAAAPAREPAR